MQVLSEHVITVGSKSLEIFQFPSDVGTNTFHSDVKRTSNPKVEGETTELFQKLQKYLEEKATETKREVRYIFYTENERMVEWARKKAPWAWESLDELTDGIRGVVVFGRQKN